MWKRTHLLHIMSSVPKNVAQAGKACDRTDIGSGGGLKKACDRCLTGSFFAKAYAEDRFEKERMSPG